MDGNQKFLLKDGLIIDGTGQEPVAGSVLIEGERIAAIGTWHNPELTMTDCLAFDCSGVSHQSRVHRSTQPFRRSGVGAANGEAAAGSYV